MGRVTPSGPELLPSTLTPTCLSAAALRNTAASPNHVPLAPPSSSTSGGTGPQPEPGEFIATLPCSTRARAFLVKQGCRTRADLLKLKTLSDAEIGRWPKVGSKTVREIRTILDSITS